MSKHTTEKYQDFEIEWIVIPSFNYGRGHGIELYYQDNKQEKHVAFIEGYEWYHMKKGLSKIYILSSDSEEWGELGLKYERIMNEIKESVYEILQQGKLGGKIKDNIYAHANT